MKPFTLHFSLLSAILFFSSCGTDKAESGEVSDRSPNILFVIADDASWKHFGAYGCDWVKTPAFDRVAKEGILFANAYTPNAKCAPRRVNQCLPYPAPLQFSVAPAIAPTFLKFNEARPQVH